MTSRLGAIPTRKGTQFTLWAPHAQVVEIEVEDRTVPLDRDAQGYHHAFLDGVAVGARYGYRLDGGSVLADPATRSQPDGVHGRSEVIALAAGAKTSGPTTAGGPASGRAPASWHGIELDGLVLYELHVGTFSEEGTFAGVIPHLERLRQLGVTAIELMPIAQFSGPRNWGYDGVFPFAAQNSYGGRPQLVDLVDAAHRHGIGVVIDVVYNHLGPEGNHLATFGPYFTDRFNTPWGDAVNMADAHSDHVRRYFMESALEWVTEVGADGLRLDAIHAIVDPTARPFLEELTTAVHTAAHQLGRTALIIAESSDNDPRIIAPPADRTSAAGGLGCDAVWNDDLHHAIRVALTDDRSGYYADYVGARDVARCLRQGWLFEGQYSVVRKRRHGRALPLAEHALPFSRLVVSDQNHDQIGNRAAGERLDVLVDLERRKLAAATVILCPFVPMLFMGEEYGERAPFPYFVSHEDPELIEAVRQGRRREFPQFEDDTVPDPAAEETFRSAVLKPSVADQAPHAQILCFYTDLLAARRTHLALTASTASHDVVEAGPLIVLRRQSGSSTVAVVFNFGPDELASPVAGEAVVIDSSLTRYGGARDLSHPSKIAPWSALLTTS